MKKTVQSIFFSTIVLTMALNFHGQTENHSLTKKEIIDKCWKAQFGKLENEAVKSIYVEGFFHGGKIPNRTIIRRPDKFRNEMSSRILVFDGQRAALIKRYPDKEGNPLPPEIIDSDHLLHFEVDVALIFPAFFEYDSEYRGIKTIDGTTYYEIFVKLPKGAYLSYFIDIKDFLIKRRLINWDGKPDAKSWENIIDAYIDYDGIKFPDGYSFMGRAGMEKGVYKNFKINIKPDEKLFTFPEEL